MNAQYSVSTVAPSRLFLKYVGEKLQNHPLPWTVAPLPQSLLLEWGGCKSGLFKDGELVVLCDNDSSAARMANLIERIFGFGEVTWEE